MVEALLLATVSVSCYVTTNYVKSSEIFSCAHLLLGLFIYLRHCDGLNRSLDLLTATVMRFVALNELKSFIDSNC